MVSDPRRLKQRLLREMVYENLVVAAGEPPRALLRARHRRRNLWLGLGLCLLTVSQLGSTPVQPRVQPVAQEAPRVAAVLPAAPVPSESPGRFAKPQPIDPAVFPLAVRRVILDPGHGGDNRGTISPDSALVEKQLTLDIAQRLRRLLEQGQFQVVMTRDGDQGVPLARRAELANAAAGDIFVSVHLNWIVTRKSRGVETYYLGPTQDPDLSRLAAEENRDSGYSLADLRRLLDGVYANVRGSESRRLAEAVDRELFSALHPVNPGLEDRGVKSAPFVVLVATQMPAILAEVSCLSNAEEARLLQQDVYRQRIAIALFNGIHAYAQAASHADQKGT